MPHQISESVRNEIINLLQDGKLKHKEIAELVGVGQSSVNRIYNRYFGPGAITSGVHDSIDINKHPTQHTMPEAVPYKLTLDNFLDLLGSLISEYKRIEARLAEQERMIEKWKLTAGKLNEELRQVAVERK